MTPLLGVVGDTQDSSKESSHRQLLRDAKTLRRLIKAQQRLELLYGLKAAESPCTPRLMRSAYGANEDSTGGAPGAAPNFSGVWRLRSTEGDMDTFLHDMGQSLDTRSWMRGLNYGVGNACIACVQLDDSMVFDHTLVTGHTVHLAYTADGREYPGDGPLGPTVVVPRWDGTVLHCAVTALNTQLSMVMRTSIQLSSYVVECRSWKGTAVREVYSRKTRSA